MKMEKGKDSVLETTDELRPTDVVLGRGSFYTALEGNQNFRCIIWKYKKAYCNAPKAKKSVFVDNVLDEIARLDPPGRFLESNPNGEGFVPVPPARSREKVFMSLRERKMSCPTKCKSSMKDEEEEKEKENGQWRTPTTKEDVVGFGSRLKRRDLRVGERDQPKFSVRSRTSENVKDEAPSDDEVNHIIQESTKRRSQRIMKMGLLRKKQRMEIKDKKDNNESQVKGADFIAPTMEEPNAKAKPVISKIKIEPDDEDVASKSSHSVLKADKDVPVSEICIKRSEIGVQFSSQTSANGDAAKKINIAAKKTKKRKAPRHLPTFCSAKRKKYDNRTACENGAERKVKSEGEDNKRVKKIRTSDSQVVSSTPAAAVSEMASPDNIKITENRSSGVYEVGVEKEQIDAISPQIGVKKDKIKGTVDKESEAYGKQSGRQSTKKVQVVRQIKLGKAPRHLSAPKISKQKASDKGSSLVTCLQELALNERHDQASDDEENIISCLKRDNHVKQDSLSFVEKYDQQGNQELLGENGPYGPLTSIQYHAPQEKSRSSHQYLDLANVARDIQIHCFTKKVMHGGESTSEKTNAYLFCDGSTDTGKSRCPPGDNDGKEIHPKDSQIEQENSKAFDTEEQPPVTQQTFELPKHDYGTSFEVRTPKQESFHLADNIFLRKNQPNLVSLPGQRSENMDHLVEDRTRFMGLNGGIQEDSESDATAKLYFGHIGSKDIRVESSAFHPIKPREKSILNQGKTDEDKLAKSNGSELSEKENNARLIIQQETTVADSDNTDDILASVPPSFKALCSGIILEHCEAINERSKTEGNPAVAERNRPFRGKTMPVESPTFRPIKPSPGNDSTPLPPRLLSLLSGCTFTPHEYFRSPAVAVTSHTKTFADQKFSSGGDIETTPLPLWTPQRGVGPVKDVSKNPRSGNNGKESNEKDKENSGDLRRALKFFMEHHPLDQGSQGQSAEQRTLDAKLPTLPDFLANHDSLTVPKIDLQTGTPRIQIDLAPRRVGVFGKHGVMSDVSRFFLQYGGTTVNSKAEDGGPNPGLNNSFDVPYPSPNAVSKQSLIETPSDAGPERDNVDNSKHKEDEEQDGCIDAGPFRAMDFWPGKP